MTATILLPFKETPEVTIPLPSFYHRPGAAGEPFIMVYRNRNGSLVYDELAYFCTHGDFAYTQGRHMSEMQPVGAVEITQAVYMARLYELQRSLIDTFTDMLAVTDDMPTGLTAEELEFLN